MEIGGGDCGISRVCWRAGMGEAPMSLGGGEVTSAETSSMAGIWNLKWVLLVARQDSQ